MEEFGRQFMANKLSELDSADESVSIAGSGTINADRAGAFDISAYKQTVSVADDNLSVQKAHLQKIKRALKAHCSAGKHFVGSGIVLAETLEKYAATCTLSAGANRSVNTAAPDADLSLVVFANFLKELSALLSSLMQSATNMTVFPLRNLLKGDVRSRNDAKRASEKACKQYELQLEKIRKERLPDDADREKRHLEIQICEFLGRSAELELKRNVEMLEHLSEYAAAIRAHHREAHEKAMRSVDQLSAYKDGIQRRRQEYEKQRRDYADLKDRLIARGGEEFIYGTLQRGAHSRQAATSMPCSPAQQQQQQQQQKPEHRRTLHSIQSSLGSPSASGSQFGLSGVGLSLALSPDRARNSAPVVTISRGDDSVTSTSSNTGSMHPAEAASKSGSDKQLMQKSGYLLKRSEGKLKLWQKRRVEVRDGALWLYHADEVEEPVCVSLLTSQLKLVGNSGGAPAATSPSATAVENEPQSLSASGSWKTFGTAGRFDVYSCAQNRRYHFQVQADDVQAELNDWINVISNVRKEALERSFVRASIGKQRIRSVTYSSATGAALLTAAAPSERAMIKRLIELIRNAPGNTTCCDCDAPNPEWLSTNLGVLICLECCGVHRELGVHVSRTQSLVIDELSASQLLVAYALGNRIFNRVFEAALNSSTGTGSGGNLPVKPRADSPMVPTRKDFIRAKYDRRSFSSCSSGSTHPQEEHSCVELDAVNDTDTDRLRNALIVGDLVELLRFFAENRLVFATELNEIGETALHFLIRSYPQYNEDAQAPSRATLDALCVFEFVAQNTPFRLERERSANANANANASSNSNSAQEINTVLHCAIRENKTDCLRVLLQLRPDLLQPITSQSQQTGSSSIRLIDSLFDLAKQLNRVICLELLEKAVNRSGHLDALDCLPDGFWPLLLGNEGSSDQRSASGNRPKTWAMREAAATGVSSGASSGDHSYDVSLDAAAAATLRVCKPRASAPQAGGKRALGYRYSAGIFDNIREVDRRQRLPLHECDIDDAVDHLDVILDVVSETLERSRAKRSAADSDSVSASVSASLSSSTRSSDRISQHLTTTRPAAGQKVITLYDCLADQDDELTFRAGETIVIADRPAASDRDEDEQWAFGYVEVAPTRRGLFPLNFVKPLEPETFF